MIGASQVLVLAGFSPEGGEGDEFAVSGGPGTRREPPRLGPLAALGPKSIAHRLSQPPAEELQALRARPLLGPAQPGSPESALPLLAQQVVGAQQGHHRHGPRQHAGIVAAFGGANRLCRSAARGTSCVGSASALLLVAAELADVLLVADRG